MLSVNFKKVLSSVFALGIIGVFSVFYYCLLVYTSEPISLHDTAHYATAGVSMVRDHKNLIYPYGSLKNFSYGAAYEAFQENIHTFDTRTVYPNQLFSLIFGLFFLATGSVKIWYLHLISCASLAFGNCILYRASRSFLSRFDSILALVLMNMSPLYAFVFPQASNDAVSYLCFSIAFWLSLKQSKIWIIAAFIGVSILIRTQLLSLLLVMPIFLIPDFSWKGYRRHLFIMIMVSFMVVFGYGKISGLWVERADGGSSVAFYFSYFKESVYGAADFHRIILDFIKDIARIADGNALYIFVLAPVLILLNPKLKGTFEYKISLGTFIIVLIPIFLYAFDSFFPAVPRYYITAIPLVAFAVVLILNKSFPQSFLISRRSLKVGLAILSFGNLLSYVNTKDIEGFSLKKMSSVASFLDFQDASMVLKQNFGKDSIVISNHALVTGISDIYKVVFVPKFDLFLQGDNRSIEGIVFIYAENPEEFMPRDWLNEGRPREVIQDLKGVKYGLIYNQRNSTWGGYSSRCLIYKKIM